MNLFLTVFGPLAVIALISLPLIPVLQKKVSVKNGKYRVILQICVFGAVFLGTILFQLNGISVKAATDSATAVETSGLATGLGYIAVALTTSCSCIGAGLAVAAAAPAAIGAISENSDNFGKAMIFVALAEGVAIYGLLISILILNSL